MHASLRARHDTDSMKSCILLVYRYIGLSGYFPGYGTFKYGEYDPYGKQSNFTSVYLIELFDLNADPFELDNIYATASPELKTLLHTEVHRMYGCAGAAQCG